MEAEKNKKTGHVWCDLVRFGYSNGGLTWGMIAL
jgi:hypothetical protein